MKVNPYHRTEQNLPNSTPVGEGGKTSAVQTSLAPGQLIKGRVVRVEGNGRVLLAIDEELMAARTTLKLNEGSEHWLEVARGGAEPWLVLAGREEAAGELLRLLAVEENGRGAALEMLLAGGDESQLSPAAASMLQDFAGLLGTSAVGDVADPARIIFGLLLLQAPLGKKVEEGSLRRRLADLLSVLPEKAVCRKKGEKLARILAATEKMNGQLSTTGHRAFLVPCLLAGSAGWGEWLLAPDEFGETATEGKDYELSFFLRMSRLGELHVQLAVRGEAIHGTFAAASAEVRQHLEVRLPGLVDLLERLGFEKVHLSCRPAKHHLLHELQEDLRRRAGLAPLALVDLRT